MPGRTTVSWGRGFLEFCVGIGAAGNQRDTKGSRAMYASVRNYEVADVEKFVEKVEVEFVDRLKSIDGLIAYYVINSGDGSVTSITLADTAQAVETSTRAAEAWVVGRAPTS